MQIRQYHKVNGGRDTYKYYDYLNQPTRVSAEQYRQLNREERNETTEFRYYNKSILKDK